MIEEFTLDFGMGFLLGSGISFFAWGMGQMFRGFKLVADVS
jgi:hypothetical protein